MQDLTDKLKEFAGQAGEGLSRGLEYTKEKVPEIGRGISDAAGKAKDYLGANPTLAAMLLAGGGSGLLGGYLTSRQPEEEGESKASRRMRILRNALIAAGAGAGAVGLGAAGLNRLSEAVPVGTQNPIEEKLTSPLVRGLGGVGAGLLGMAKGENLDLEDFRLQALKTLTPAEAKALVGADPAALVAYAQKHKGFVPRATNALSNAMSNIKSNKTRNIIEKLLGTTRAGQFGRGAAAAGFFLPEILGQAKDLMLEN